MPVSSKSGIEKWFWLTENFHSERYDLLPVSVRLRHDKSDFKQDVVQRRSSNVWQCNLDSLWSSLPSGNVTRTQAAFGPHFHLAM